MTNNIQTFYIDPATVQNAGSIFVSSVELFVKTKPTAQGNQSGIASPGITVSLCAVSNETPDVTQVISTFSRVEYNNISTSTDGTVSTVFAFVTPQRVTTDQFYGIMISFDDPGFIIWANKTGENVVGSTALSPGVTSARDGKYFQQTNTSNIKPVVDTSLKFRVNAAKFNTSTSTDFILVNGDYEFLTVLPLSGPSFIGGELVFANTAYGPGSVAITSGSNVVTGTGTSFNSLTVGQPIIFQSSLQYNGSTVSSIANSTYITLNTNLTLTNNGAVFYPGLAGNIVSADYITNKIIINNSSANTTLQFVSGQTLRGIQSNATATVVSVDNFPIDRMISHINTVSQTTDTVSSTYNLSYSNGSALVVDTVYQPLVDNQEVIDPTLLRTFVSRSNELSQPYLYSTARKSGVVKITMGTTNPYTSPVLVNQHADVEVEQNKISASHTATYANNVVYDTEVFNNGTAQTRHITTKLTFDKNRQAEDVVVYLSAYRPLGTNIEAYARIINASDGEPFDDKLWTPLALNNTTQNYSSAVDSTDLVEYQFNLPSSPPTLQTLQGTFTTVLNQNTIAGVGNSDLTVALSAGKLVKIYSPYFPSNYMIARVMSSTTNGFVIDNNITDNNIVGSGFIVDVLLYNQTGFSYKNAQQNGVARYYNSAGSSFDRYTTLQVKLVLSATNTHLVPFVDQLEVIGVSA